jgi:CBS domain-containing protein
MIEKEIGRVLVVERRDPKKLLGLVTRTDIMHVFMWPMKLK